MSITSKILLSRFLTRFGDQAWDFVIPLVLISIYPGQIQNVAGYFLITKAGQFFLNPLVLRWIDHLPRKSVYKLGIGSQTIAVILTWILITNFLGALGAEENLHYWLVYLFLGSIGIVGSLGSTLMEISVGYDLAADQVPKGDLPVFNSRRKRVDLFTEVVAPICAGLLMLIPTSLNFNTGFTIVAALNLLTFIPEYFLLSSIQAISEFQKDKNASLYVNPIQEFRAGINEFKDLNYVVPMVAYACLWISVLSPHGVLLAGYLKDGFGMSEFQISIFRGLGAFFGMVPTFLYPIMAHRYGFVKTSKLLLGFQTICIVTGSVILQIGFSGSLYVFLVMILFSRIGLYGYSIGESEARQLYIPHHCRGRINAVGVSLTSFATLIIFALGSLVPKTQNFSVLVWVSSISIIAGFLIILKWNPASQNSAVTR